MLLERTYHPLDKFTKSFVEARLYKAVSFWWSIEDAHDAYDEIIDLVIYSQTRSFLVKLIADNHKGKC